MEEKTKLSLEASKWWDTGFSVIYVAYSILCKPFILWKQRVPFFRKNDHFLVNFLPKRLFWMLILFLEISETPKETGFHQSTRLCLEQIREAMLHHRWQEAAEYMACYPQILEATTFVSARRDKEVGLHLLPFGSVFVCSCPYIWFLHPALKVIWRIGTEILHHHPNSKLQDYNIVYERMKHAGFGHYLMVCSTWLQRDGFT